MTQNPQKLTPMLKQYFDLKAKSLDSILFFRMGDFYEVFGEDAELVSKKLNIILTSRESGQQEKIPFCGVPHHSAKNYFYKLIDAGYKVAIAEQLSEPTKGKGLVDRDIVKILAPGCIEDLDSIDNSVSHYLCSIYEVPKAAAQKNSHYAFCALDITTMELRIGKTSAEQIPDLLAFFQPKQILVRDFWKTELVKLAGYYIKEKTPLIDTLPEQYLRFSPEQKELLKITFGSDKLATLPCGVVPGGEELVASVVGYLKSLQIQLRALFTVKPLFESDVLELSETVLRDLEIFESSRRKSREGSLLSVVDHTVTLGGGRVLRERLGRPSRTPKVILQRHSLISSICSFGMTFLQELRVILKKTCDLERLSAKLNQHSVQPKDFSAIAETISEWLKFVDSHDNFSSEILGNFFAFEKSNQQNDWISLGKIISDALEEPAGALGTGYGVLKADSNRAYGEVHSLAKNGQKLIEDYEQTLRTECGIATLKIRPHQSFGLLIEVTKSHLHKVPESFIRRQSMMGCERFVTHELKDIEEKLSQAESQLILLEAELFAALVQSALPFSGALKTLGFILSELDVACSFAWLSLRENYNQAKIGDGSVLMLSGSRHPVVQKNVGVDFTPNSCNWQKPTSTQLLTGPNMAGKSTFMRQIALCAIINQAGGFVPADSAELPVFDQIFTRIGAADDLSRGLSTFMVEMLEAATILRQATASSLVILDEVGRGTSTTDGLALAFGILAEIDQKLQCFCLFATHYHELIPLSKDLKTVAMIQSEVRQSSGNVEFTHKIVSGAASQSYGLVVARKAGIPERVLEHAEKFLSQNAELKPEMLTSNQSSSPYPANIQHLIEQVEKLNLNRTTPLQALNTLASLKADLFTPTGKGLFDNYL